jgi:predicted transcriptional regulator
VANSPARELSSTFTRNAPPVEAGPRSRAATTVAGAALRRPKLCRVDASVDDVRSFLLDDHVHMALLVDGDMLITTLERQDVEDDVAGDLRAVSVGQLAGRTIPADATISEALEQMTTGGRRRLAVVDGDHHLVGLLCLKHHGHGFCSDDDVRQRAGP